MPSMGNLVGAERINFHDRFQSLFLFALVLFAANTVGHFFYFEMTSRLQAVLWLAITVQQGVNYHMYAFNGYISLYHDRLVVRKSVFRKPTVFFQDIAHYDVGSKYLVLQLESSKTLKVHLNQLRGKQKALFIEEFEKRVQLG